MGHDNLGKELSPTFDIGYEPGNEQLMKMLAEHSIHATFFVIGNSVVHHPEMIEGILKYRQSPMGSSEHARYDGRSDHCRISQNRVDIG